VLFDILVVKEGDQGWKRVNLKGRLQRHRIDSG
jgi:hypothetical protein